MKSISNDVKCYHCGDICFDSGIKIEDKNFCCNGCKTVFEILDKNNLCQYYDLNKLPGNTIETAAFQDKYAYLDQKEFADKFTQFSNGNQVFTSFQIPGLHCSSCVFLLENLYKILPGIIRSEVFFQDKRIKIVFDKDVTNIREIVITLSRLGYEPNLSLAKESETDESSKMERSMILKIGVAGFCVGNIMMLSLPDYLSLGYLENFVKLKWTFNIAAFLLSFPALWAAAIFFKSALSALKQRVLVIDLPIALAIAITFLRSVYEVFVRHESGYFDSMSGIIFFMLIGRYFQFKATNRLNYQNDLSSYFPFVVNVKKEDAIHPTALEDVKKNDIILIRNGEVVPADGILLSETAELDCSFLNGESETILCMKGEQIYGGSRLLGSSIELYVDRVCDKNYFARLWNNAHYIYKEDVFKQHYINFINKYFTLGLLVISVGVLGFWLFVDTSRLWNALTSILIVACPCALLLSASFTYGAILGILRKNGFFAKDANTLELLSGTDVIVFDKTGTISAQAHSSVEYHGRELAHYEKKILATLAFQSNHIYSKQLLHFLNEQAGLPVEHFKEIPHEGVEAIVGGIHVKLGKQSYVDIDGILEKCPSSSVYFSLEGVPLGYFKMFAAWRPGFIELAEQLKKRNYQLYLLSGDKPTEDKLLKKTFGESMYFSQTPMQKRTFIQTLQQKGKKVIMIGDGLNDAGAIKQSDVGIVLTDNTNNFLPACNAILKGTRLNHLMDFIEVAGRSKRIVHISFLISLIYNVIGLYYAVQGILNPMIAAILMPASTISIVLFTSIASYYTGRKYLKDLDKKDDKNHISL
ncbi:MAG: heavy metal translocating P-type ATPase metal-binding domain-containing protein [Chitinophagales bacterium]|nr:heavy metal translocating P-type ATPase metal-binding domain-containing protein [Chitinophagales bacterium]